MAKTAADQIAEMMIDAGIQRVYGVVDDSINPIVDAIRRCDGKLRWVQICLRIAPSVSTLCQHKMRIRVIRCL